MHDLKVLFALDWPWWLVVLVTAMGVAAVAMFYRRAAGSVSRRYLMILLLLRVLAMLALFLCLFRPVISYRKGAIRRSRLPILADRSKSMSIRDFPGQPSRFERVREVLLERDGTVARLEKDFDLSWHVFDRHAATLEGKLELDEIEPDGEGTDLYTAAKDAVAEMSGDEIGGIVLLTDGVDTSGNTPERLAGLQAPVYAVGVGSVLGSQENFRDILIESVDAKREVTVRIAAPITISVEAIGYAERVVPVVLKENDMEIARERLVLDNAKGVQKVTLNYVPQRKGDFELTVSVPPDPGERVTENNTSTIPVFVGDAKIRVLYIEGTVRPEFGDLNTVLQHDPNVEIISFVRLGPGYFLKRGAISDIELDAPPKNYEDLVPFRALLIGSIERSFFSDAMMEGILRFVSEGGGLMMIGGEHSFGPGGYGETPIEEALPVVCGGVDAGQEREPFNLTLTEAGKRHPIFAGIAGFFEPGGQGGATVPALLGCTRVERAKPAADILAVHPGRSNEAGPLIAVAAGRFGSGRVVAATIDSTRLWYVPLRGMGRESPYVRYWGQAMRWLAGEDETPRDAGPGVAAYSDRHFYEPGEEPILRAFVTDPEGQATDKADVKATIVRKGETGGTTAHLPFVPETRNEYEAHLGTLDPGRYAVKVEASLAGASLGEAEFAFFVGEPTREFEKLDLDAEHLAKIAADTGGLYLPIISFNQLPAVLRARSEKQVEQREIFLWNTPGLFVAFLLLISGEWILRKRRLLS